MQDMKVRTGRYCFYRLMSVHRWGGVPQLIGPRSLVSGPFWVTLTSGPSRSKSLVVPVASLSAIVIVAVLPLNVTAMSVLESG